MIHLSQLTKIVRLAISSILFFFLLLHGDQLQAQVTVVNPLNQPVLPLTDFLGWEPSVDSDVNIRHLTPGEPILFGTNGVERMRISPNVNRSVLINTTTANNAKLSILKVNRMPSINVFQT